MKILLAGFGVVPQAFVKLIGEQSASLYRRHGISPVIVGAIDSRGAAISPGGLDGAALLKTKEGGGSVSSLPVHGFPGLDPVEVISQSTAELVIEATPTTVGDPTPSLERLKAAFRTGKHVVCINKAPLAVAFPALQELSRHNNVEFRYSGTVGGGTPMLAMAKESVRGDEVESVRAILNGTCNFILWKMEKEGLEFDTVLAEAMKLGYAEADPSADIDGIDTATKLVILANGVLGRPCTISDLSIKGIRDLPLERVKEASKRGKVIKLIAEIGKELKVEPQEVDADSPLNVPANLNCLGLELKTSGPVALVGRGAGGPETATAVLRDLIDIWHSIGSAR